MRNILLTMAVLGGAFAISAQAATKWTSGQPVAEGDFYLYNIGTGTYLNAGDPEAKWGTHAYMNDQWGYKVTLAASGKGYTIKTPCSEKNNKNYLTSSLWSDGLAAAWTFTPVNVNGYTNVYEISINNTYLTGASTKKVTAESAANGNNSYWLLLSKDQLVDNFKNATESNPVDATFLLTNPEFQRHFDGDKDAWTCTNDGGHVTVVGDQDKYDNYYGCEFWNNTFDIHQTVTGLVPGRYTVTIQGFGTNGTTYLYANDTEKPFVATDKEGVTNMHDALANIAKNTYEPTTSDVISILDGKLTYGVKRTKKKNTDWTVIDNFSLQYVGALSSDVAKTSYTTALTNANTEAAKTDKMSTTAKSALTDAISTYGSLDNTATTDQLTAATTALNTAVTNCETSITAYAAAKTVLDARKALAEANNFYTDEAYKTYYTDIESAYEDGTLADATASALTNPNTVYAYKAAHDNIPDVATFLNSGTGVTNYTGNPYVNTWSVEGASDESNFTVPFYEYFASDANSKKDATSLKDATLTFTKTGLEAGTYKVTLWARAQMTYGKTDDAITGITMNVNDGTSKTFAPTSLGKNSFYLGNETLYGTVGSDGTLKLNVVVANTNSSWLSLKNVKYEKVQDMTLSENETYNAATTGEYNVTVNRTLPEGWNTLVLPFALTNDQVTTLLGNGAKVAEFSNSSENTVNFTKTTSGIKANTPVMVYVDKEVTSFAPGVVTLVAGTPEVKGAYWTFEGNYNASYALAEGEYMLYDDNTWWKNESGDNYTVKGMRAYLKANNAGAAKLSTVRMVIDGTATAINGINSNANVNNAKLYNLAGQRVNNTYKGVVIVNGKKVILK